MLIPWLFFIAIAIGLILFVNVIRLNLDDRQQTAAKNLTAIALETPFNPGALIVNFRDFTPWFDELYYDLSVEKRVGRMAHLLSMVKTRLPDETYQVLVECGRNYFPAYYPPRPATPRKPEKLPARKVNWRAATPHKVDTKWDNFDHLRKKLITARSDLDEHWVEAARDALGGDDIPFEIVFQKNGDEYSLVRVQLESEPIIVKLRKKQWGSGEERLSIADIYPELINITSLVPDARWQNDGDGLLLALAPKGGRLEIQVKLQRGSLDTFTFVHLLFEGRLESPGKVFLVVENLTDQSATQRMPVRLDYDGHGDTAVSLMERGDAEATAALFETSGELLVSLKGEQSIVREIAFQSDGSFGRLYGDIFDRISRGPVKPIV